MKRALCILIILISLLASASAAPAPAATVDVVDDVPVPASDDRSVLHYRAAPGEANRLTLAGNRTTLIVRDAGARLVRGRQLPLTAGRLGDL